MKVFDLTCDIGHRFEGWFASAEAFAEQCVTASVRCPMCDSSAVQRAPSAPRLNLGHRAGHYASDVVGHTSAKVDESANGQPTIQNRMEVSAPAVAEMFERLRHAIASTENVGPRFAEEARRIHYDEIPARPIRGTATDRERRELHEEGIETLTVPIPTALTETLQ